MPRYATGSAEAGSGYELYGVCDHSTDAAAIDAFETAVKEDRPDLQLVKADSDNLEVYDFVARVGADFPLDADGISDDDIVELVETYDVRAVEDDDAA